MPKPPRGAQEARRAGLIPARLASIHDPRQKVWPARREISSRSRLEREHRSDGALVSAPRRERGRSRRAGRSVGGWKTLARVMRKVLGSPTQLSDLAADGFEPCAMIAERFRITANLCRRWFPPLKPCSTGSRCRFRGWGRPTPDPRRPSKATATLNATKFGKENQAADYFVSSRGRPVYGLSPAARSCRSWRRWRRVMTPILWISRPRRRRLRVASAVTSSSWSAFWAWATAIRAARRVLRLTRAFLIGQLLRVACGASRGVRTSRS